MRMSLKSALAVAVLAISPSAAFAADLGEYIETSPRVVTEREVLPPIVERRVVEQPIIREEVVAPRIVTRRVVTRRVVTQPVVTRSVVVRHVAPPPVFVERQVVVRRPTVIEEDLAPIPRAPRLAFEEAGFGPRWREGRWEGRWEGHHGWRGYDRW